MFHTGQGIGGPSTPMLYLTWAKFNHAARGLADYYRPYVANGLIDSVQGVPRGGMPLAVALSHYLRVPLISGARPTTLIIDDMIEAGQTRRAFKNNHFAAWVAKCSADALSAVVFQRAHPDTWVVFPWEDAERAEADRDEHRGKRSD